MYGHVEKLAEEIRKGAASVEGVEAKLWQAVAALDISQRSIGFRPFIEYLKFQLLV